MHPIAVASVFSAFLWFLLANPLLDLRLLGVPPLPAEWVEAERSLRLFCLLGSHTKRYYCAFCVALPRIIDLKIWSASSFSASREWSDNGMTVDFHTVQVEISSIFYCFIQLSAKIKPKLLLFSSAFFSHFDFFSNLQLEKIYDQEWQRNSITMIIGHW